MYIFIGILCIVLLVWSIIQGKTWAHHWLFIVFECIINLYIIIDLAFKIKLLVSSNSLTLQGCRGFFRDCNNTIDFMLGIIIVSLFAYFFSLSSMTSRYIDEIRELIFYIWFIWQQKRLFTLFKDLRTQANHEERLNFSGLQEIEESEPVDDLMMSPNSIKSKRDK